MLYYKKKRCFFINILLVTLLGNFAITNAQTTIENNITIDNGLINNEVTAIHQDAFGFLWFGTRGGLNKYNGYDFSTLRSVPRSANNLSNQAVEVIAEYKNTLWIGNKIGGLNSYNILKDSITHYNSSKLIKIQEIKSLLVDNWGSLFIGALHGLYILKNDKFTVVDKNLTINALAKDSQGYIWVGTTYGLFKYDVLNNKLDSVSLGAKKIEITSIAIDNQSQNLFLGTWGNGLIKYNITNRTFKKYIDNAVVDGSSVNNTYRVLVDRNNNVWVGTWGGGLRKFDITSEKFEAYQIKPSNIYNKDYNIILSIVQDNTGIIWIGTDGGGVCKLDPYGKKFKTITNFDVGEKTLDNTHITSVYEDKNGRLWLGTKNGGLNFSSDKKHFVKKNLGINTIRVNCFFENNKDLWVGTGDGLVIFKDFEHGSSTLNIKKIDGDTTSLSGSKITTIIKDKKGIIWVGTQESGLNRVVAFKNDIPVFKRYPEKVGVVGAIQNDRISCMLVDKNNHLWVGTYDGLHLYDKENDKFELIAPNIKNGLSNNTILSLAEDSYGNIWVGTQQGLNKMHFEDGVTLTIKCYYQCAGFPNDYVHAVLIDNENNVWMSTNKGITKFNIGTNNFRNFDTRDGVSNNTFSENSSYLKSDGEMFFGGINGVTFFYPDSIYLNHYNAPVYITNLQINNQNVGVGKVILNNKILSNALFLTQSIKLSYKGNIISFSYASLDYHASDKNQYQYILEGFDEKWVDAGNNRTVTYTSLPSGTYTFKVRASNGDQIWSDAIATMQITILPPPWKTWWAYTIYFLIISGLLWLSRHMKINRINLKNKLEIANINYAKEHEIAEVKNQFFTNISHEFRTPLTLMIGPLEDLVEDENINSAVKDTIHKIQNQAKRLLSLINQLLDFHKAETKALKLNTSYNDIVALSKSIYTSFEKEADRKGIQFAFTSNIRELYISIDKEKVESIMYNLLSNAFKFTPPGGDIKLELTYMHDCKNVCEILVADTGNGIKSEDKERVFDRFYQVTQAEPGKYVGTGIGLAFVKDLVELHNGIILLEDNQPQGSLFRIKLPLKEVSFSEEEALDLDTDSVAHEIAFNEVDEPEQLELPIILVIEDNEDLNHYLCKTIGRNWQVISAKDGKEGLEKAFNIIPDLVVSDVMMPEMDGYEFCKLLKGDNRTSHIPVILLTAKSDDVSQIEGIKLGADVYLGKPFKPALLASHIKNLIQSRKKLKALFTQKLSLGPSEVEVNSFDEEFVKNAIRFVEENIEKDEFLIDELATKLNMSRSTFYRKLKALTGMSGSDFIRLIKLKRSAQLLKTGEYTVSIAAYSSGFNDLKNFRKIFQKQFGVTPSEYMKQKDV